MIGGCDDQVVAALVYALVAVGVVFVIMMMWPCSEGAANKRVLFSKQRFDIGMGLGNEYPGQESIVFQPGELAPLLTTDQYTRSVIKAMPQYRTEKMIARMPKKQTYVANQNDVLPNRSSRGFVNQLNLRPIARQGFGNQYPAQENMGYWNPRQSVFPPTTHTGEATPASLQSIVMGTS